MLKINNIFWKLSATSIIVILAALAASSIVNNLIERHLTASWILPLLTSLAIALVLSLIAARLFLELFIMPSIRRLSEGLEALAEKKFDFRLVEDGHGEFDSLAEPFNDMADMLNFYLAELEKTKDYLNGILESSADIIITVTPSGNIRSFNTGAANALGYRPREVIGKPVEMLFVDPRDRATAIERLKFTDSVVNYETRFLSKNGEVRIVLLTLSRLRNAAGEIIGTIGISKDITEEKRLQNQLMQSERFIAIGQVFTGIQHSMKNMLNACKGGAYMVNTGLAKDDRTMLEEGWKIVQEGVSRMTDMSMDMLKYVKEWKPKFEPADMNQTMIGIDRVMRPTAKDRGIEFGVKVSPEMPQILCDVRMIHSVVMDIVSNALDACAWKDYLKGEVPKVEINAYPAGDGQQVVIEITDNGCGMTDDVKSHIFTPFFSTKSKAGTGLGLSISYRMINVHGGKIEVESEADIGTVFRIVLPIDETHRSKENIDGKKGFGG